MYESDTFEEYQIFYVPGNFWYRINRVQSTLNSFCFMFLARYERSDVYKGRTKEKNPINPFT